MNHIQQAIIKTLCYADIFDYPLTHSEIHNKLISSEVTSEGLVKQHVDKLSLEGAIAQEKSYYYLIGRGEIVKKRINRAKISEEKLLNAKEIARKMINLPYVRAIFLTGAVAVNNASVDDDLDIMVITTTNSLYSCRFFVNGWLELKNQRRHPEDVQARDKICSNLFLTEESLMVPKKQQNLYTAHEVVQAVPLEDPDNFQSLFLKANSWTQQFLANKSPKCELQKMKKNHNQAFPLLETTMRTLQLVYMAKKRTREIITQNTAYFHPRNTAKIILDKYDDKTKKYL